MDQDTPVSQDSAFNPGFANRSPLSSAHPWSPSPIYATTSATSTKQPHMTMNYVEDESEMNPEDESMPEKKSKVSVGLEKGTAAEGLKKAQETK
jgi:hypothetical protein